MNHGAPAAFLDTSVVVRYLTNDPPDMASRAAEIIDGSEALMLSELVLLETAYVLTSVYKVPRSELVDALVSFVQRANLSLSRLPKPDVLQALLLCRDSNRHSFTDALLWAEARHARARRIYTFDRRFPGQGLEIVGLE